MLNENRYRKKGDALGHVVALALEWYGGMEIIVVTIVEVALLFTARKALKNMNARLKLLSTQGTL